MRSGVLLPHRAVVLQSARRPPLEVCWAVARLWDEAGLALWVGDSVVAKPRLKPLTTLAYLAAMTQRARLGTAVLLPALRQATVLAHALANIDQISHGRQHEGCYWLLPHLECHTGTLPRRSLCGWNRRGYCGLLTEETQHEIRSVL